jgi:hypothetical protein
MPPDAIKEHLVRVAEELSDALATMAVIQSQYQRQKDWMRSGAYLQFQHKLGEVLMGLDKQMKDLKEA